MNVSIYAEKSFYKIQHHFMIKSFNKPRMEGNYFNIINIIYEKPTASIILNNEKLKAFTLRSGTSQGYPFFSLVFNIVVDLPTRSIKQEKERASKSEGKREHHLCLHMT